MTSEKSPWPQIPRGRRELECNLLTTVRHYRWKLIFSANAKWSHATDPFCPFRGIKASSWPQTAHFDCTPTPLSQTFWGLFGALSEMLRAPVRAPADNGWNSTKITQLPLAAMEGLQLVVWAKLKGFAPVISTRTAEATFPAFFSVTS